MNLYCYGANDERGKLIELNIPAKSLDESKERLLLLVGDDNFERFRLNDARAYCAQDNC